jgi:hypothetical protein
VLSCIQCTKNWTTLAAVCRTVFFLFAKAGKRISQSRLNNARIGEENAPKSHFANISPLQGIVKVKRRNT